MVCDNNILHSDYGDVSPVNVPLQKYILDKIRGILQDRGDSKWMTDYSTNTTVTYSEIIPKIQQIVANLKSHGFQRGDFLLFYCGNHIEFPLAQLAVLCCGGGATSISPSSFVDDVVARCADASARFVLCDEETLPKAAEAAEKHGNLKLFSFGSLGGCIQILPSHPVINNCDLDSDAEVDLDETVLIFYSSGTTGRPKGIVHTHRTMTNMLESWYSVQGKARQNVTNERTILFINYMIHIGGTGFNLLSFLFRGHCIILSKYSDENLLQAIHDTKPATVSIFPPQIAMIVKHPNLEKYDMSSVDAIITGGSTLNSHFCDDLRRKLSNLKTVAMSYGMSETGVVTMYVPDPVTGTERLGSSGKLMASCSLKIEDVDTGESLPAGHTGEICIKNPYLLKGYLHHPQATAEFLRDGWAHTGDVGYYDEDGFLFVTGRIKELVKYKMQHVVPAEVEAHLLSHPAIQDAVLVGKPNDDVGELPAAFVVLRKGLRATEEDIIHYIEKRVPDEARLRGGVYFTDQIPRNDSGKPMRRFLISQF